jgi:hypothetical protein
MGETDQLRELHDAYVWRVNAAVAENRMDLVWEFVDEYTDEALRLIAPGLESAGCGRPDCAMCAGGGSSPALPARRRWFSWRRRSSS